MDPAYANDQRLGGRSSGRRYVSSAARFLEPEPDLGLPAVHLVCPEDHRHSSEPGASPVCTRVPGLSGCEIDVAALGAENAGAIFFRTLAHYCNATHDWSDFGSVARQAAYDLFATTTPCYNAYEEQQSVMDAFSAIGYPPSQSWLICGCGPNC